MASDRPDESFQVTILNSPAVNAFALPNGRLYVTRGLLALANDTSEIAAVLSHEIAHVTLRHASQRSELQARSDLIKRVAENVLNDAEEAAVVQNQSRSDAGELLAVAGARSGSGGREGSGPGGLRSLRRPALPGGARPLAARARTARRRHGWRAIRSTDDRMALALAGRAARQRAGHRRGGARSIYLTALDGLAYGDDPADGVVQGRRFIHSRLGVAFEAPEGFTLENTSQAVLGASSDGERRLLFDAADTPNGQSLEEVLRSTWTDTIEPGQPRPPTTVNGLPVVTALSNGKEWSFRLSAIRIGNTTFRLIMAARGNGSAIWKGSSSARCNSVRQVQPDEARRIRPLKLEIVTAQRGDTPQSLAARMAGGSAAGALPADQRAGSERSRSRSASATRSSWSKATAERLTARR